MTDRELLELAAKAAGEEFGFDDSDRWIGVDWNPLTDDGDALRLAVKLRLHVDHSRSGGVTAWVVGGDGVHDFDEGVDPYASTRRAIVRAAAEIGRTK